MNMISTVENIIKFLENKRNTKDLIEKLKEMNPKEFILLYEENGNLCIGRF